MSNNSELAYSADEVDPKHICEVCGDIDLLEENTTRSVCRKGDHYRMKFLTGTPSFNNSLFAEQAAYDEELAAKRAAEEKRAADYAEAEAELTPEERGELIRTNSELSELAVAQILEEKKWREYKQRRDELKEKEREARGPTAKELRAQRLPADGICPQCREKVVSNILWTGDGITEPFMCKTCRTKLVKAAKPKTAKQLKQEAIPKDNICTKCNCFNESRGWVGDGVTAPLICMKCYHNSLRKVKNNESAKSD